MYDETFAILTIHVCILWHGWTRRCWASFSARHFFVHKFLLDIEIIRIFYGYLLSNCCLSYGIMYNDKWWIERGSNHWLPSQIYRHVKWWKSPLNCHCFCGFQKPVYCMRQCIETLWNKPCSYSVHGKKCTCTRSKKVIYVSCRC